MKKLLPILLLLFVSSCGPQYLVPKQEVEPLPPFCVPKKIRTALVLGSGGVRGMAHVGVIEELERAGIPIDLIVGCSAGSIVGALYADHPCASCLIRPVWKMRTDSILNINLWRCRYGLCQGRILYQILDNDLKAETFEELKIPLVIVATDLNSGELVPMGSGDLVGAVRASCSIPLVFVPFESRGRILVDGGVANPVPVQVARDLGAELIIAVDLCELLPKTFPTNLFGVATRSAEIAFMWQNDACARSTDVLIQPKLSGVGAFNDKMKKQIYMAGKLAAREKIPKIKQLLEEITSEPSCEKRWVELDCYSPRIYDPSCPTP